MGLKQEIEVLLFWKDEPITSTQMAELLGQTQSDTRKALNQLIQDYDLNDRGLHITHNSKGYILAPRPEYYDLADRIMPIELKTGTARTLAVIIMQEPPILQSDIIKLRGSTAYDHIKELEQMKLIKRDKDDAGHSYTIKITKKCKEQFSLDKNADEIRESLSQLQEQQEELTTQEFEENTDITEELMTPVVS